MKPYLPRVLSSLVVGIGDEGFGVVVCGLRARASGWRGFDVVTRVSD